MNGEPQPLDRRDSTDPEWTIDPDLSCSNTDFGGEDPAIADPDPEPELEPAWIGQQEPEFEA